MLKGFTPLSKSSKIEFLNRRVFPAPGPAIVMIFFGVRCSPALDNF